MAVPADAIRDLVDELRAAPAARHRELRQRSATRWGVSERTVYRLTQAAMGRQRQTRSDAGQRVLSAAVVAQAATMLARTKTKKEKIVGTLPVILDTLERRGLVEPGAVSPATLGRCLREYRLSRRQQKAPSASIQRISRHPNHVHLVDASICLTWYLREDGRIVRTPDVERRFYAGKPHEFAKLRQILYRYILVDHCTNAFFAHYYYSSGERAEDLIDFLLRAWSDKAEPLQYPFRGVPLVLAADQGPGMKAQTTRNLLANLDVEIDLHMPGVARASGAVENMMGTWERWFEARLLLSRPMESLGALNDLAHAYAMSINAHPRYKVGRHGMTRRDAWVGWMRDEYLRTCPDHDTFWMLAHRDAMERTVDNRGRISVALPGAGKTAFELRGVVHVGEKVSVRLHPYQERTVRVWNADGEELEAIRLEANEHGFLVGGRVGGFAGEDYDRHRDQEVDRVRRAAAEESERLTHDEAFGDPVKETPPIPMIGAPLTGRPALSERARLERVTYTQVEALRRVRDAVNRPLTRDEYAHVTAAFDGEVIDGDELDRLIEELPALAQSGTA